MSRFHSTVSRRTFMKGLGLAGAGLGTAAAAAPVFHDLDEAMASPKASRSKMPWYVTERDAWDFTTEVDWSIHKAYDARNMTFNPHGQTLALEHVGVDLHQGWQDAAAARIAQYKAEGIGKYQHRDFAFSGARGFSYATRSPDGVNVGFLGPRKAKTPDELGYPKWSGTAEENSNMVRLVLRYAGALEVGIFEVDPEHGRKFVYTYDYYDGKKYTWADVPDGYETGEDIYSGAYNTGYERVIPEKARYGIVWMVHQSEEGMKRAQSQWRYFRGRHQQNYLQDFLRGLGYQAYGPPTYPNEFGFTIPMLVASGLAEQGRLNAGPISPIYPVTWGSGGKVVTDFPLVPDKPIDAGINRFCYECKTCATICPGDALGKETEPTYDGGDEGVAGPYNNLGGYKHWWYNPPRCRGFRDMEPCFTWGCAKWCPFANKTDAFIHDIVATTLAVTPVFNSFLATMNETFGYGPHDPAGWWDLSIPTYGIEHFTGKA